MEHCGNKQQNKKRKRVNVHPIAGRGALGSKPTSLVPHFPLGSNGI